MHFEFKLSFNINICKYIYFLYFNVGSFLFQKVGSTTVNLLLGSARFVLFKAIFASEFAMEAIAKHDFNATAGDELSFRKTQVLKVRYQNIKKF